MDPLNNNYGVTQFYHGVVTPDGKSYFGGTQDNGTVLGTDLTGSNNWKMINGADGGYSAVDFINPNTFMHRPRIRGSENPRMRERLLPGPLSD